MPAKRRSQSLSALNHKDERSPRKVSTACEINAYCQNVCVVLFLVVSAHVYIPGSSLAEFLSAPLLSPI